jgi:hypothetical protein
MLRKLDLFASSGGRKETPAMLASLERANLNHWTMDRFHKPVILRDM